METTIINNTDRKGSFVMLARKMFIENRKTLLMLCGGYLGALAVVGLWSGFNGVYSSSVTVSVYYMLAGLVCAVTASLMFHDFTTKEGRINALMTPASRTAKFWLRLLAVVPGVLILVLAGYYVLAGCMNLAFGVIHDIWLPIYNDLSFVEPFCFETFMLLLTSYIFSEGMFIFGAIAWPRKSFLKTLLVQAGLGLLLSTILIGVTKLLMPHYTFIVNDGDALMWILLSMVMAAGLALIYAAYMVFKRSAVIK